MQGWVSPPSTREKRTLVVRGMIGTIDPLGLAHLFSLKYLWGRRPHAESRQGQGQGQGVTVAKRENTQAQRTFFY